MHISWLGRTGLKIQTKPINDDVTVLLDPYTTEKGSTPRNLTADIVLFSRGEKGSITMTGAPFVLSTPGECEMKGVLLSAAVGNAEGETILRIDSEGISLAHLGLTKIPPTSNALEMITGVDILCLPVGGGDGYDPEAAVKVINLVEPRVIIPLAFHSENDPEALNIEKFIKEIGIEADKPEKKVILKKKDLPQEDMRLIVLEKE